MSRKKIGFLSFGHYRNVPGARVPDARTSLLNHVEIAVGAEEAGIDGAWLRVHHFDQSLSAPIPLLTAMAMRTTRLEVGTGVVDMRYENPLYLASEASALDLLSGGRLQLGVSRGSPEPAADGQAAFGYTLEDGESWNTVTRERTALFRRAIAGEPVAHSQRALDWGREPDLPIEPHSPALGQRLWWGAGSTPTGVWAGQQGMNLLSSTLLLQDDGRPFHVQQAHQIAQYRAARAEAGFDDGLGGGLAAVTRSAFPLVSDDDRRYFLREQGSSDGVGFLDGSPARSGPSYVGSPEEVAEMFTADEAIMAADYVLFALPSQLGVDYNVHLLSNLAEIWRDLGWSSES